MAVDEFEAVEQRIRGHEGQLFRTMTGLPLRYVIEGDRIRFDRVRQRWSLLADARRIWEMGRDAVLGEVDQRIVGRAYLFAVLRDPRIAGPGFR